MYSSTTYRFIARVTFYALSLSLVSLIGCTNFTSTSAGHSLAIAAVDSSQNAPVAAQVIDGFEDYKFPTPETAEEGSAAAIAVDGSVANGEVAVGRVSQSALAVVDTGQAQLGAAIPVVTGLAVQTDYETGTQAGVSTDQRPIPTVSANAAANAAVLSGSGNQSHVAVDRNGFIDHMRSYRDSLRELVYLVDVASGSGTMSCADFRTHMVILDAVPRQMDTALDLQLATYYLQQSFEKTELAFRGMSNYCSTIAGSINLSDVQPASITSALYPGGQQALNDVYEAVLWVNGDISRVRELYYGTRGKVASYEQLLKTASGQDCAALNAGYEAIIYSPQLSLPDGQVQNTYAHYASAVNLVANGGGQLYQACSAIMNGNGGALDDGMLAEAQNATGNGLTQLDVAIAYLP